MEITLYTSKQGILNALEGKTLFAEMKQSSISDIEITINAEELQEINGDIFVIKVKK